MKRSSSASDTDSDMTLTEMDSQRQLEALQKLSLDLRRESIGNLAEIQEESENFARRNSRILNEEMAAAVAANPEAAGDAEDIPFRFAAYCIQDALEGRDNHGRLNLHRLVDFCSQKELNPPKAGVNPPPPHNTLHEFTQTESLGCGTRRF